MAAADLNTIRSTVEGRIATELTGSPVLPVVFHNMAYEPTPILMGSMPHSLWQQRILGPWRNHNNYNRIAGLMVINVFTPKGAGPGANYVIGKRIRDLYNRVIVSGVFFGAPIGPEALASPAPGGYFATQVRVTFEFIEEL